MVYTQNINIYGEKTLRFSVFITEFWDFFIIFSNMEEHEDKIAKLMMEGYSDFEILKRMGVDSFERRYAYKQTFEFLTKGKPGVVVVFFFRVPKRFFDRPQEEKHYDRSTSRIFTRVYTWNSMMTI